MILYILVILSRNFVYGNPQHIYTYTTSMYYVFCDKCQKNQYTQKTQYIELLIHEADPQSRPIMITIFTHVISTHICPYGRPSFQNFSNQNKFQVKNNDCYCGSGRVDH